MFKRRSYKWDDGRTLVLNNSTLIMGILNGTPDSFSDGGKYNTPTAAIAHAREMEMQGADLIDLGVESTRPGHTHISVAEEISRMERSWVLYWKPPRCRFPLIPIGRKRRIMHCPMGLISSTIFGVFVTTPILRP